MKRLLIALSLTLGLVSLQSHAAGNVEAGKAAAAKYNCAACHGADYNSPIDPSYPKLAGQHEDYLRHALIGYQRGAEGANGRGNAIMSAQSKMLTRDDVRNIAAYLHSLPGTLALGK